MPEIPEHLQSPAAQEAFAPSAAQVRRAGDYPVALPAELAGFVRQLPQCVFLCDASGRCVLANRPLLSWLGREESEVVGRSIFELWPNGPQADALAPTSAGREAADLQLVLEGNRIEQVEIRPCARGRRAVRAVKFPWVGVSGQREGMVVLFDELDSAVPGETGSLKDPKKVGDLARGIVHDLNNALMMLYARLSAIEQVLPAQPAATEAVEGMYDALEHARHLPRLLLKFARGEPIVRQPVDLNVLLASLEGLIRPRLGVQTAVEMRFAIGGAWVEGESVELARALLNLAGNALDAMPRGGRLTFETRRVMLTGEENEPALDGSCGDEFSAGSSRKGAFIRVAIRDSGSGIAPAVMPHIFESLFTTRSAGTGTGLGLAIVKEIAERHDGWVTCQSNPGQGTCFFLYLPALELDEDSLAGASREPAGRVLFVEPDSTIRQLALVHLGQGDVHIELVESLEDAHERLTLIGGEFDLVVVSSELCVGLGGIVLSRLLARLPRAGLLVTNSGPLPPLPADCHSALHWVLEKPYKGDELVRMVRGLVGSKTPAVG
jgi:signal transduction histidine kinase